MNITAVRRLKEQMKAAMAAVAEEEQQGTPAIKPVDAAALGGAGVGAVAGGAYTGRKAHKRMKVVEDLVDTRRTLNRAGLGHTPVPSRHIAGALGGASPDIVRQQAIQTKLRTLAAQPEKKFRAATNLYRGLGVAKGAPIGAAAGALGAAALYGGYKHLTNKTQQKVASMMPEFLQAQQSGARPVSGEDLEVMGKRAANIWAQGRFNDLTESVMCVIKEASLSPEQVKRVAEFANVNAFLTEFYKEGAASKYVDFGESKLADPARLLQDLNDGGNSDPGELVDFQSGAYGEQPSQVKTASIEDDDWIQVFGDPAASKEYPMAEPYAEYWNYRDKLAGMRGHLAAQLSGLETAYLDVAGVMYGNTKRACMDGVPLGDVVRAWSSVNDDPILIKCAFEIVTPGLVKDEVFRRFDDVGESITKVSSARVVNPQHPLVTSYQDYCEVLNKLAETREQYDGLAERIAFIEYQFEKNAGSLVGALRGAAKHTGSAGAAIGRVVGGKGSGAERILKGVGKAVPVAALGTGAVLAGAEGKAQLEDSPTANFLVSGVAGTRQNQVRRAIRRQEKAQKGQESWIGRQGLQYMQ